MRPALPGFACLALACGCAAAQPRSETPSPAPAPALAPSVPSAPPPAEIAQMLGEISAARLSATVARLAAFGTRHTLSDPESPTRGIGAARRHIEAEMEHVGPPLQVTMESHRLTPDGRRIPREVELVNVVAVLPGALPEAAGRRYYVVGHYDSRASDALDATSDAPGANDDASGAAVVLELARVMARHRYDATLVFLATAGEEQGLLGARKHVETARAEKIDIRGVLNNDIVGDPSPSPPADRRRIRVFSEGGLEDAGPSRELARFVAGVAAWHGLPVQPML